MADLPQVATPTAACKCCGKTAALYGVVDFYQTCAVLRPVPTLGWSGIPIYYHRCGNCGFLFTTAFDQLTPADFAKWVYNDQYILADPEYYDVRPVRNADNFALLCGRFRNSLRILDYGCGTGNFAKMLRERGFAHVAGYDPFVPEFSKRPEGQFDMVVSYEVVEHSGDPAGVIADMLQFMSPGGMVYFTTMTVPENAKDFDLSWWYIAPRNGHISIQTPRSLAFLAEANGAKLATNTESHVIFRPPVQSFVRELLPANFQGL